MGKMDLIIRGYHRSAGVWREGGLWYLLQQEGQYPRAGSAGLPGIISPLVSVNGSSGACSSGGPDRQQYWSGQQGIPHR
jgi:hypothetical protein